jgi:hypothetical protein
MSPIGDPNVDIVSVGKRSCLSKDQKYIRILKGGGVNDIFFKIGLYGLCLTKMSKHEACKFNIEWHFALGDETIYILVLS